MAFLLAVALLGMPLAGCWSRLETSELASVIAYGVDWHNGRYTVVASVLDPRALGTPGQTAGEPNKPAHILMMGSGSTPGQAFADLDNVSSRRMLWASAEVMVIGQSLAEHGISPLLSAVTHDPDFRPTIRVVVSHGDAQNIFAVDKSGLETSIGRQLYLMLQNQHRAESYSWAPHVFDIERFDAEQQRAILVPGLKGAQPALPEGQAYSVDDSAVLDHDRLVGWLPRAQVRPVLWVEGDFIHGRFQLPCPNQPGQEGVVFVTGAGRRVRAVARGGRISAIAVNLRGRGQVTQGCSGVPATAMGRAVSATVSALFQQSLQWAQGHALDVFGFGETAYRHAPGLWLGGYRVNWPQAFSELPVHVIVQITVTQPGMTA